MSEASQSAASDDPLAAAVERLERACARVGARLDELTRRCEAAEGEALASRDSDADRARLAEALDDARAREAELESAAREADAALAAAMGEIAGLLGEDAEEGS